MNKIELALKMNKLVHNDCRDVPHDIGLRLLKIVEDSLIDKKGFTSGEILDEMDKDLEESGLAQGEIVSCLNHWRNKYLIIKR
jgi:hypothetical protein